MRPCERGHGTVRVGVAVLLGAVVEDVLDAAQEHARHLPAVPGSEQDRERRDRQQHQGIEGHQLSQRQVVREHLVRPDEQKHDDEYEGHHRDHALVGHEREVRPEHAPAECA